MDPNKSYIFCFVLTQNRVRARHHSYANLLNIFHGCSDYSCNLFCVSLESTEEERESGKKYERKCYLWLWLLLCTHTHTKHWVLGVRTIVKWNWIDIGNRRAIHGIDHYDHWISIIQSKDFFMLENQITSKPLTQSVTALCVFFGLFWFYKSFRKTHLKSPRNTR